ncbi:GMC oxidoreductase [Prevotella communis]|uniref:GMC oxidoreductase n=1 Tax=Prevotella communis TaxID=2913614 RepID=UPI003D690EFC
MAQRALGTGYTKSLRSRQTYGRGSVETLHSPLLPDNLYVCDASLLPQSLGLPPILTIMALAKRIAKLII